MAPQGPNKRMGRAMLSRGLLLPARLMNFPFTFPHAVGRTGSGRGTPRDETLVSSLMSGWARASPSEPIAFGILHDAAVGGERRQPLIKRCVTHAALRPERGERERRCSVERGGNALIE